MFDPIKRLGDVSDDREELRRHIFSTYISMRIGMLLIALAFPLLLWFVGGWYYDLQLQDSMSAYYWATIEDGGDPPMRVWFVGLLFALGSCLFLYKGYTPLENGMLNLAALCAICVALFPMCWKYNNVSECPSWSLHGVFAIVFFVLLALVAVLHWLYASGRLQGGGRRRSSKYYTWAYGVTAAGMVFFPLLTLILFEANHARTYLVEVAGIAAFCLFWGVQSWQIHKSQFDQKLAQSE
jgi:hypothetical protein